MAYTVIGLGSTSNTTGATLVLTTGALCPEGAFLVVVVAEGGTTTAIGSLAVSAGAGLGLFVSGALNNVNANGWGGVFFRETTADLPNGGTITYTKTTSGNAATLYAFYVTGVAGSAVQVTTAFGSSTTPSVTLASPAVITQVVIAAFAAALGSASTWTQGLGASTPQAAVNPTTTVPGIEAGYVIGNNTAFNYAPTLSVGLPWWGFIFTIGPNIAQMGSIIVNPV